MAPVLSLAVCLFENVAATDFQGPLELFGFIAPKGLESRTWPIDPAYAIEASYLSVTLDPVSTMSGPALVPTRTYDSVKPNEQFDVILVPGGKSHRRTLRTIVEKVVPCTGTGSRPGRTPDVVLEFIKTQTSGAKYVLSVCTGSEIVARTGILDGHKATTNKSSFTRIKVSSVDSFGELIC